MHSSLTKIWKRNKNKFAVPCLTLFALRVLQYETESEKTLIDRGIAVEEMSLNNEHRHLFMNEKEPRRQKQITISFIVSASFMKNKNSSQ